MAGEALRLHSSADPFARLRRRRSMRRPPMTLADSSRAAARQRPRARLVLRAGGARLHDGLRRREAAELRPWRPLHGRAPLWASSAFSLVAGTVGAGWLGVALSILLSMLAVGFLGVVIERIAYAPMLKAPRLSILITALAVSLVLQNGVLTLTNGQIIAVQPQARLRRHQSRRRVHQLQADRTRRHRWRC